MIGRRWKGLVVAAAHVAIVASLGGKLVADRSRYPRAWARTAPVDPDLPIRGRYVRLRLEAAIGPDLDLPGATVIDTPEGQVHRPAEPRRVVLAAADGLLVAHAAPPADPDAGQIAAARDRQNQRVAEVQTPVAFFIPENVPDPSVRAANEELWVEVTLPPRGAPRPIRLAVRRDGQLTPLDLR